LAAFALVVSVANALSVQAAGATGSPTLKAQPSTSLSSGQTVKVTGSGFKPHDQVFLVECLATATSETGCDTASATPATISGKGLLPSTKFKVVTGKIGDGTCGTSAANVNACVINAGNANGSDTASASIAFRQPHKAKSRTH
jgi:hypothetical protein